MDLYKTQNEIFFDDFDDNRNNWPVLHEDGLHLMMGEGQWGGFNRTKSPFIHLKPISINYNMPFVIEAPFTFEAGYMPHNYALVFGSDQDATSCHLFLLNAKHQFTIATTEGDNTTFYTDRKPQNLIVSEMNVAITLTILKKQDRNDPHIYFLIDQQEVYKTTQIKISGDHIGFFIGSRILAAIDYLSVKQIN